MRTITSRPRSLLMVAVVDGPELRICLARTLTGGAAYGSGSVLAAVDFVVLPRHRRPYRISNNGQ